MTRLILSVLLIVAIFGGIVSAENNFSIGSRFGLINLSGGEAPKFAFGPGWGANVGVRLSNNWWTEISFMSYKLYDDSTSNSILTFVSDEVNRTRARKALDFGLKFKRSIYHFSPSLILHGDIGGGVSFWERQDPVTGDVFRAGSELGGSVDVAVSEVFLGFGLGLDIMPSSDWKLDISASLNHLTGTGQEFVDEFKDSLSTWKYQVSLGLSYMLGSSEKTTGKKVDYPGSVRTSTPKALSEPVSANKKAKSSGKVGKDADKDGVMDIYDLCPETPDKARNMVDLDGCPIDTDFDGIPDYIDQCPDNKTGAVVDNLGCPIDSDNDGVPDGVDNCPHSQPGMAVDQFGCVDLSSLSKPMILHIKYDPGSFEIDRKNKARLDELAKLLKAAPGVRIEMTGYTDNVGLPEDNKSLSLKRARRVKEYLIRQGIDESRLSAIGKGEVNFIASNKTSEGRQKNRRVELNFYRK